MLMATDTKRWTIADLDSLPDDGNTYEVVRGELLVSPPPAFAHETIVARLHRILDRYVEEQGLGYVHSGNGVVRHADSQVQPDLAVRELPSTPDMTWDTAPLPILVVEVHSQSTRRHDLVEKRELYMDAGIDEYWMVDGANRTVTSVAPGRADVVSRETMTWHPKGVSSPLTFEVARVFG
ncbi:MAG: Uma2 family endonuclease [Gemmatimonadota bacterium]